MWTLIYIIIILQQATIFVAGGCGGYYTSMTDSFTSENYPSDYPDNSKCRYTIMVPEGYSITLTFIDFHLEAGYDFVSVKENVAQLFHSSGKRENITTINSSGNSLYVYFTSDGSVTHSGFSATYYTNSVGECGGYYTSRTGSFTSENYPSAYPDNSRCRYTIMVPEGYSITLTFTHFHLEARHDVVLVKENIATLFSHNGEQKNIPPINSSGNSLYVYFTSDYSVAYSGFSATYYTNRVVNGGWSSWLKWNSCTVSCGGGISTRSRYCINPAPSNGGTRCVGDSVESRVCNTNCCPVNGNWSTWSIWDNCDVTCGFGIQQRTRTCDNPYPVFGGFSCTGKDLQIQNCSTSPCPVLIDSHKQLYTLEVVGGVAVACIICTSGLCLIVHRAIRRLRQNKGREETRVDINERDENYEELRLRRTTQSYDNVEYIRPENPQGDVCGNTERPESNVYENVKY